ncbi:hypothetical protein CsatB_013700 [Cannabis sativa]
MYPWFAFGHITPFIHLSNKLAEKGHTISFIIPPITKSKVEHLNRFPNLITFYPITFPHVEGLPSGAETTRDVPFPLIPLIVTAMDKTESQIEFLLRKLKPQFIFYDFSYWVSKLAHSFGIKSMHYSVVNPAATAYNASFATHHNLKGKKIITETDLMKPPPGFPDPSIHLHFHEARDHLMLRNVKPNFRKPTLLTGPLIPDPPSEPLEKKWVDFLGQFNPNSVIYCGFGSEVILTKSQFQELLLGLELSGFPFLASLRTPSGANSIEEALPDGFQERIGGRGVVYGGWIQQPQILNHPSIGCIRFLMQGYLGRHSRLVLKWRKVKKKGYLLKKVSSKRLRLSWKKRMRLVKRLGPTLPSYAKTFFATILNLLILRISLTSSKLYWDK